MTREKGGQMTHWHAGWNMVGYLPEMDPSYPFEDWADAKQSMIDDLLSHADSADSWVEGDCDDDIPCGVHGEECGHDQANTLSGMAEDLNLDNGPGWDGYVGHMHYWIVECAESECAEEKEYA